MKKTVFFCIIFSLLFWNSGMLYSDIPALERGALIELYNSTNGDGWTNNSNWNGLAGSENTWYGITCNAANTTVVSIDLAGNNLDGTIPGELGNLTNLTILHLNSNSLTGSIPAQLGNLTNLNQLWLGTNQLTGSIPYQLGSLANLAEIDLRRNQLEGSIPAELGDLENLTYLNLTSNRLSGSIPSSLGMLSEVVYFYLNSNELTGSIPPQLGNLEKVRRLYLNDNNLLGDIPASLGGLADLQILRLADNRLSGTIPPELGNLPDIQILNLSNNRLSGSIPPELGSISTLNNLSIRSNKIIGNIPLSMGNLTTIDDGSLDLRWNGLYTDDDTLRAFLNQKQNGGDWESTQTIVPENVAAAATGYESIMVSWTPIVYSGDDGGYRVFFSTITGGPYTYYNITTDKTVSQLEVANLVPGTRYYFLVQSRTRPHVYNANTVDSEYSAEASAFTSGSRPTVTTNAVTNITLTTAASGGNVTDDGGVEVTARGVCWSTLANPNTTDNHTTDGSGTGIFTSSITGLSPGTTYHVRAYAINRVGTAYGSDVTFVTATTVPTVFTADVSGIELTTAICGGNVTDNGGAAVTARGVCWSTSENPSISDSHTTDGSGTGTFTSSITGLNPGTTYHVRAYATNSSGTAYGIDRTFTTNSPGAPTVTTGQVTDITSTSASAGGNVTNDNGSAVTARGVCWSTSENPSISDSHTTDGSGTGTFTSSITGLSPGTTYHVRAYATNSVGTSYGGDRGFTTNSTIPTVTTADVSNITSTTASGGGNVTGDGGAPVTARGVCWSTTVNPFTANNHTTDGTGTGTFTSSITGLNPGTTYHIRAYATNSQGTAYGSDLTFTTAGNPVISGRVTYTTNTGTAGLAGVTLTFSNLNGTAATDANGNYSYTVPYGWSGTVTPFKAGYTFNPVGRSYNNLVSHQAGENYTATGITNVISGIVTDSSGSGMPGVILYFSNSGGSVTTDVSGNYALALPYGWGGIVTPFSEGYTFDPVNRTYPGVTSDIGGQDYIATPVTPEVSGQVTNSSGTGIGGVLITFSNNDTIFTDANGYYSQTVSYNWSGDVTPSKEGFTFTPELQRLTDVTSNRSGIDFTAVAVIPVISGRLTNQTGTGIYDVKLDFSNGGGTASSDANGNYVQAVPFGWSGTVTPSKTGFTFQPDSRTYNSVTTDLTGQNYTVSAITPIISGRVTHSNGIGISGVVLTFSNGGGSVTTDTNGNYLQAVPFGWSGTAAPAKTGYIFSPASRAFNDIVTNQSGQNYTGTAITPVISGRIISSEGIGVPGVSLLFSPGNVTAVTDSNGNYNAAVNYGWSGTVTPEAAGLHFSPNHQSYTNVIVSMQGQDYTCIPDVTLNLQVSREIERARIIRRHYGKITLNVENVGAVEVSTFVIYRKTSGENHRIITEFPGTGQAEEAFTFDDTYLEKNTTYTYKAEALAPGGQVIGTSIEVTI